MSTRRILALSGGVGGAKLCLGLQEALAPGQLQVIANTADDFNHLGLRICPDIDTVLYTLSGLSDPERGWGRAGESWTVLESLGELGGDTWFQLGDKDLATHLYRTHQLDQGGTLTEVTQALAQQMGVTARIFPMSDSPVATRVFSDEGKLPFQEYFVARRCEPRVTDFEFEGLASAGVSARLARAMADQTPDLVIVCPSNPFVSIDPILGVPGMRSLLDALQVPVVAVSPIVSGMAIKGPAAKMMEELGMPVTASGVAQHYAQQHPGLLDAFVIDESDATLVADCESTGVEVHVMPTVMRSLGDKQALAERLIALCATGTAD